MTHTESISGIKLTSHYMSNVAESSYNRINQLSAPTVDSMDENDRMLAIRGLQFTRAYYNQGNPITNGNCGGGLNLLNPMYNEDGIPPTTTFSIFA